MTENDRSDAWKEADSARSRANDLAQQAAEAAAEAARAEARATAEDEGIEYAESDPLAGTWEGAVSGSASGASEISDSHDGDLPVEDE